MAILPGQKKLTNGIPGLSGLAGLAIDTGGSVVNWLPISGGTVTLNGVTPVVVANKNVGPGSIIEFTLKTVGGTVGGGADIQTITPGTGFTVNGTAGDTSVYNFVILG